MAEKLDAAEYVGIDGAKREGRLRSARRCVMADLCVHCGDPVVDRTPRELGGAIHARGTIECPDGSGHIACPPQGGLE